MKKKINKDNNKRVFYSELIMWISLGIFKGIHYKFGIEKQWIL